MKLFVNNEEKEIKAEKVSLTDLLKFLELTPDRTAVAVNDNLILKSNWDVTWLADNDRVTIIKAAFGG